MELNFVHLKLHTEFSLSDGLITIPSLFKKIQDLNMPAVAITDLGNLFATIKFYQEALKCGIKPIIGAELNILSSPLAKESSRLTLLCQNDQGYRNLLKLISRSYLEGQRLGKPYVLKKWLIDYSTGIIALSGIEGEIGQAILNKDRLLVEKSLANYATLFKDRFYIEISRIGKTNEREFNIAAIKLADSFAIPLVATNDARFLEKDDFEAHEAKVCVQQSVTLNDTHRTRDYTEQQYIRSQKEMLELFSDVPEALENTVEIAKRCNVIFTLGVNRLPHFPVPEGYSTPENYLIAIAEAGLTNRLQNEVFTQQNTIQKRTLYEERLHRELTVINEMGFAGYFLIVADFTKWAKENGIPVGPGRGSGAGSLVAYALKITDLDPLALDLLFERFLNPERVSMPDFDIDFCISGRDRVIQYVIDKHGVDSVSQIITYGTMAAKAVVRDVGRVLGHPYGFVDKIAKLIPFELGITLEKALTQEPNLRERYEQEEEVRNLIDLAKKLEGITRNVGKHAGGIVIAPGKLTDFVPLYCEENETNHPVTQFDKDDIEATGLVKFDFLGLKTLTIIDHALTVINEARKQQQQTPIDIILIPLADKDTFNLLKNCQSTAIFQLESHGMRDLIRRLKPDCFQDLMALVALFRPGPLQSGMVDDFINRKHGRAKVLYPHPKLEPILRPTYGVILYQEQVMQIAQVLAGYTLGAADILRHAMGKKKLDEMARQREKFCEGAKLSGVNIDVSNHIFDLMEKFAGYGFNKAHSASYALIAYQTAWLKTHYKAAFMASVLSHDMDRTEKLVTFLHECQALKLQVLPPNINSSSYDFKVLDDQQILYGLGAIKGVGSAAIENIISTRDSKGSFKDLFDFCDRVDLRKVNRRVIEALIKSGCFDALHHHRARLFSSINRALKHAEQKSTNDVFGQHDLLTDHSLTLQYEEVPPFSIEVQLQGEKETLGFYLTGHPLHRYEAELPHLITRRISELTKDQGQNIRVAGTVSQIRTRQTKRGQRFAIFSLDDGSAQIETVCFSECYQKYRSLITEDQIVLVEGDVSLDEFNQTSRILCRDILTLEDARASMVKALQININDILSFPHEQLKALITSHTGGSCPIIISFQHLNAKANIILGKEWQIKPTDSLLQLVKDTLGMKVEWVY